MNTLPPLSLYIHIPWCVRKCPYCDFNSHVTTHIPEKEYLRQLLLDLEADLAHVQGRVLQSIFIGGGTPSLMSGDFYKSLLSEIQAKIDFSADIEITLEANPGTIESGRFKAYREAGINRLSLGVQSFNDTHLVKLGRIHSADEARSALEQVHSSGIENFNIDLMHGLPEQTLEQALSDIESAMAFSPTHLSWYQLTIEANTEFYRYPPHLPQDEVLWSIQEAGIERLEHEGFAQYEISAYSKTHHQSVHNKNYWTFGDYLGIGAGAHAKISLASGAIHRYRKTRLPADYLKCVGVFRRGEEEISRADLPFEFMMNVLRLKSGVSEALFEDRTGLSLRELEPQLTHLRSKGLLQKKSLATTKQGLLFLNDILEQFALD